MLTKRWLTNAICAVVCWTLLASCSSTSSESRDQVLGGLGGAALGAGIGALATGGNTKAVLAGAAAGAVAGWATVKLVQYHSEQTKSAKEEATALGYRPSEGTVVKIRGAKARPEHVRPGETVTLDMDYAVLAPAGSGAVPVEEKWTLEKDGETLASVPPKQEQRAPGGWHSRAGIDIPKDAQKGTYVVKNRVEAGSSYDERVATFAIR
jgi:outer membrane lipoprotein SlyB